MKKTSLFKWADEVFSGPLCRILTRPQNAPADSVVPDNGAPLLLVRPGGLGDAIMTLPLLYALRRAYPSHPVEVLAERRNGAVFDIAFPGIRVLSYDSEPLGTLRRLRRARYAAVFDTEQFHGFSGILAARTRAPVRIGFKVNARRNGLYTHLASYDLDGPEDAQFLRLLAALGQDASSAPQRFGILAESVRLEANGAGTTLGPLGKSPYVLFHVGGSSPGKCWNAAKLAFVATTLLRERGLRPVIVGTRDDVSRANTVHGAILKWMTDPQAGASAVTPDLEPVNLCGKTSLPVLARLCAGARLLIGPDSGVAHLAYAVGTPTVVLFGPSDPRKWGPSPEHGAAVTNPVPCGPCAVFGYNKPCNTLSCLSGIRSDAVLEAAGRFL